MAFDATLTTLHNSDPNYDDIEDEDDSNDPGDEYDNSDGNVMMTLNRTAPLSLSTDDHGTGAIMLGLVKVLDLVPAQQGAFNPAISGRTVNIMSDQSNIDNPTQLQLSLQQAATLMSLSIRELLDT